MANMRGSLFEIFSCDIFNLNVRLFVLANEFSDHIDELLDQHLPTESKMGKEKLRKMKRLKAFNEKKKVENCTDS